MTEAVKEKIVRRLDALTEEQQRRVLDFTYTVAERPVGTPGKDLLRFAGTISEEDVRLMERAIEEDCERIDPDPDVDFDR